MTHYKW